jgi:tetratricopeptide (TPR) repeat protein
VTETSTENRFGLHVLVVVLLAFFAYFPALGNDFAFDDTLASPTTNDGGPDAVIGQSHPPWFFFGQHYWAGEGKNSTLYRPVTILSYAWTHHAVAKHMPEGWTGFPHHLINLLLGAWAAFLVLWMMRDVGVCAMGALLTAALFGVHALHSEVVAGIVGRAELFSFCFGAAGLQALRRSESHRPFLWLTVWAVLLFFALCSKENAIAWIGFVPCYLAVRSWRANESAGPMLRSHLRRMLSVFIPVLVTFFVLRGFATEGMREDIFYAANPLYHESVTARLLTAIKIWGYAVYKCVAPFSLASIYGLPVLPVVSTATDPGFLAAAALLLTWLAAGLRRPARAPLLFLSVAIFFGFSFITSNVPLAIGTIFGERLYYIPSLGVCMLPALLLERLPRGGRRGLVAICAAWLVANIVVDFQRSMVWKNNQTLVIHDAGAQPRCASLQVKAATMHRWLQKQPGADEAFHEKEAWRLLRLGRELDPEYVSGITTEASFRGQDKKHDEALALLREALKSKRLKISGLEAGIRADLGMLLIIEKKQTRAGLDELMAAMRLRPRRLPYRMSVLDHGIGVLGPEVVQRLLVEALEIAPNDVMLGVLQAAFIHEYAERIPENYGHIVKLLQRVFRSVPDEVTKHRRYITARVHLGDAYAALNRKDEARRAYEFVVNLTEATAEQKNLAQKGLASLAK